MDDMIYEAEVNAAMERLRTILPHLELAADMAQIEYPDGKKMLTVSSIRPNGSGGGAANFEFEPFIADIKTLLGDGRR